MNKSNALARFRLQIEHDLRGCAPKALRAIAPMTFSSENVGTLDLLPFCYPTAQYEAGQDSIKQWPMLENGQLIQTCRYGMVREVIRVAELGNRRLKW